MENLPGSRTTPENQETLRMSSNNRNCLMHLILVMCDQKFCLFFIDIPMAFEYSWGTRTAEEWDFWELHVHPCHHLSGLSFMVISCCYPLWHPLGLLPWSFSVAIFCGFPIFGLIPTITRMLMVSKFIAVTLRQESFSELPHSSSTSSWTPLPMRLPQLKMLLR